MGFYTQVIGLFETTCWLYIGFTLAWCTSALWWWCIQLYCWNTQRIKCKDGGCYWWAKHSNKAGYKERKTSLLPVRLNVTLLQMILLFSLLSAWRCYQYQLKLKLFANCASLIRRYTIGAATLLYIYISTLDICFYLLYSKIHYWCCNFVMPRIYLLYYFLFINLSFFFFKIIFIFYFYVSTYLFSVLV